MSVVGSIGKGIGNIVKKVGDVGRNTSDSAPAVPAATPVAAPEAPTTGGPSSLDAKRALLASGAYDSGATRSDNQADVLGVSIPVVKKKEATRTLLG